MMPCDLNDAVGPAQVEQHAVVLPAWVQRASKPEHEHQGDQTESAMHWSHVHHDIGHESKPQS